MTNVDFAVDDDVELTTELRRQLESEIVRMVRAAARTDGRRDFEVALRFTSDATIRELNRDYRDQDRATDVLAFAQREGPAGDLHPELLGDLIISVETARRQAKRGLHAELLHLASHGLCHLLGYDHRTDDEERDMNTRARALRREAKRTGRVQPA